VQLKGLRKPIAAEAEKGIQELRKQFQRAGWLPHIIRSAATGYGENLIKAAFGLDDGVVETLAHYHAARAFDPDVSFILDIGGQDMKAIYIRDQAISDIQVNEACSSAPGQGFDRIRPETCQYRHLLSGRADRRGYCQGL